MNILIYVEKGCCCDLPRVTYYMYLSIYISIRSSICHYIHMRLCVGRWVCLHTVAMWVSGCECTPSHVFVSTEYMDV